MRRNSHRTPLRFLMLLLELLPLTLATPNAWFQNLVDYAGNCYGQSADGRMSGLRPGRRHSLDLFPSSLNTKIQIGSEGGDDGFDSRGRLSTTDNDSQVSGVDIAHDASRAQFSCNRVARTFVPRKSTRGLSPLARGSAPARRRQRHLPQRRG